MTRREVVLPWSGLIGGAAGWFLSQQTGANAVFAGCAHGSALVAVLVGLIGLALALGGAVLSWRSLRGSDAGAWRFAGRVGALVGTLLAFPIALHTLAALIVPVCYS